jgi:hypothetical protein
MHKKCTHKSILNRSFQADEQAGAGNRGEDQRDRTQLQDDGKRKQVSC